MSVSAHAPDAVDLEERTPAGFGGRVPGELDEREPTGSEPSGDRVAIASDYLDAALGRTHCSLHCGLPHSVVDLTKVVVTGEVVLGAVAVAWRLSSRPGAPKAHVTMGPGGWVSLKGGSLRIVGRRRRRRGRGHGHGPLSASSGDTRSPVWARLLRARRVG